MDNDWDDHFPDGVFAYREPNSPRVKVRKLVEWCRANGIPLSEIQRLPQEIMEQFLVYPDKDAAEGEREQD